MNSAVTLQIENLSVSFYDKKKKTQALKNISFDIKRGEFVSLIGPSGCGKTTLLNCISGLQEYKGKILIDGKSVCNPNIETAVVFQDPLLLPWKNVSDNLTFGALTQGKDKNDIRKKSKKWIKMIGLSGFENYYPHQLSGGMKQRVNLARAMVCDPEIVLLDEPFANIDAQNREILGEEIMKIWKKTKKTYIFVTHQITEALILSERVIVLSSRPGKIIADIKVELPYPRNKIRFSNEFIKKEKYLTKLIEKETKKKL